MPLLVCPRCHGDLAWDASGASCASCDRAFGFAGGIPKFHDLVLPTTDDAEFQADQMFNRGLTGRVYNLGKRIVNSAYKQRDPIFEELDATPVGSVVVELGSGNRRLRDDIINVDVFPFPNVDVVADVAATPLRDSSVDLALLESLIEHVPEPHKVVAEVHRIVKPGGRVVCVVPFIFPYHGYPKHYCNFSRDGLEVLFKSFSRCDVMTGTGPTSALTNLVSEYFAIAVAGENNKLRYTVAKGVSLLPIFYLKYLDRLWPQARSSRLAGTLCAIAVK